MKKDVDIRVEIDPSFEGMEVLIKARERSPLVEDIIHAIDQCAGELYPRIMVYQGETRKMLRQQEILRVYTENRKLIVRTDEDLFEARSTLREIEKVLESRSFVRISRFEIVNMGRSISFENTVIVMTSNAGAADKDSGVGFNKTDTEIAADLGRTEDSISSKRRTLGLRDDSKCKRRWRPAEDKKLKKYYNQGISAYDIGQLLGRSLESVEGRLHRLRKAGRL